MATVSIRQFAKDRGVSDTAIRKAIIAGKIVEGKTIENGQPRIIPEIATVELDFYDSKKGEPKTVKTEKAKVKQVTTVKEKVIEQPQQSGEAVKPPAVGSLAAVRLITAQLKAKMLEVDLKTKSGLLIDKSKVYSALFGFGKEMRVNFQAIPDRFIDDILSAGSRNEAHTVLFNAITDALESLSDLGKIELK